MSQIEIAVKLDGIWAMSISKKRKQHFKDVKQVEKYVALEST